MARHTLDETRFRAALRAGPFDLSLTKLARAAKVPHPTVSRALSPRRKHRVNTYTLERLAGALKVPAAWLTGEQRPLPFVPEYDWWDAEKERVRSRWEEPTAGWVRFSWLLQQINDALVRDLREWYGARADRVYKAWG